LPNYADAVANARGVKRPLNIKLIKSVDLQKRHLCIIDFIRILVAMSANTVSVSSEFDIFASKPIQSSVLETT